MFSMPESYCNKSDGYAALGKLTLTILSLSYGMSSRQATKRGQTLGQSIKNLVLWISFSLFSLARMIAIFSLLTLSYPLPALLSFMFVHILMVLLIQACLNKKMNSIWTLTKEFVPNLISAVGSHTLWIDINSPARGTPTFLKQTIFQAMIMIENLIMLLLPVLAPGYYPQDDCFQIHPSLIIYSCSFWLVGALLQVIRFFYFIPIN